MKDVDNIIFSILILDANIDSFSFLYSLMYCSYAIMSIVCMLCITESVEIIKQTAATVRQPLHVKAKINNIQELIHQYTSIQVNL